METVQNCLERAAKDRIRAERAETVRQREIYLSSAQRWEEMAVISERGELARERLGMGERRTEEKKAAHAERNRNRVKKVTPRSLAQATGEPTYTTGDLCKRGHRSARWTSTGTCIKCAQTTRVSTVRVPESSHL